MENNNLKLNITNLKKILQYRSFSIDNDYILSSVFIIKITDTKALELLKQLEKQNLYKYENLRWFLKKVKYYKTKKYFSWEYSQYADAKIKFTSWKKEVNVNKNFIDLYKMLNFNKLDDLKFNIDEKDILYIENNSLIMGV